MSKKAREEYKNDDIIELQEMFESFSFPIGNFGASQWSLFFSPKTDHLEAADDLGEVYLWNLDVAQELARICDNTSQIRQSYWGSLFPNIEYIQTCRK